MNTTQPKIRGGSINIVGKDTLVDRTCSGVLNSRTLEGIQLI